jgi:hypothetical protein
MHQYLDLFSIFLGCPDLKKEIKQLTPVLWEVLFTAADNDIQLK